MSAARADPSIGNPTALSDAVEWKLVESLFRQRTLLIVGGLTSAATAALCFLRTWQVGYIWWGLSTLVCLVIRIVIDESFARRKPQSAPDTWRRRFLFGSWLNGIICGLGGAGAILCSDAFAQILMITKITAFVMGTAARNSGHPKAATGSIWLAELPLLLACLATRDIFYVLYTPFIVLFCISSLSVSQHLYDQGVRFFVNDEDKAELVGEITRSNRELAAANDNFAVANINFAAANEQLAQANQKLAAIAATDGLTGVPNRRTFDAALEAEIRCAWRDASDLSLLIFDIDWFKEYNDHYGHQAGDECLQRVARALESAVRRPRDLLARYGGEEFVALLPQTDLKGATIVAEAVRCAVEALRLEHVSVANGVVTVSIGAATSSRAAEGAGNDLLRRADEALYGAKRTGRNCVCAALEERPPTPVSTNCATN